MELEELEEVIRSVVATAGLHLYEVSFGREAGRRVLRVTVDGEGGVDLDSIGQVSEQISRRLDLEDFAPGPYALEVSSPGLERPLRRPEQFAAALGQQVLVKVRRPGEGSVPLSGTLARADEQGVTVATEDGERTVAYADVASARTVFEWGPSPRPLGPPRRRPTKRV
jgi:ribosome maturation factor RimP